MATKTFAGQLDRPIDTEPAGGDKIYFYAIETLNEITQGAASILTIDSDGNYSVTLAYGTYSVYYYSDAVKTKTYIGQVEVNASTSVSTLPDLVGTTTPIADDDVLTLQQVLIDGQSAINNAQDAQESSEDAQYYIENSFDIETSEVVGDVAAPDPALHIPFNDGLRIESGYGTNDQIDVSAAQDGSAMINLPSMSVDFSRTTDGYTFNKSGYLAEFSADSSGVSSDGILSHEAFSSLLLNNTSAPTSLSSVTATEDSSVAGVMDANNPFRINETTADGSHYIQSDAVNGSFTAGGYINACFILKFDSDYYTGTNDYFRLFIFDWDDTSNSGYLEFYLNGGMPVFNSYTCHNYKITPLGNGFFKIDISYELPADTTQIRIRVLTLVGGTTSYTGDVSRNYYFSGWQVSYDDSFSAVNVPFVPTGGSSETVTSNIISLPFDNNFPTSGSSFTLEVDTDITSLNSFAQGIFSNSLLDDAHFKGLRTTTNGVPYLMHGSNSIAGTSGSQMNTVPSSGDNQLNYSVGGGFNKLVLVYDSEDLQVRLYISGVYRFYLDLDSELTYTQDETLYLGSFRGTAYKGFNNFKNLKIYQSALTADQVKALGAAE